MATVLGGIGLFLLGMTLLTDGLKAAAGDALRSMLQRFTRGPWSSLATGVVVTLLVQSSTATTVTTIGFVSAGLLSFQQSVGVIFGANLGTTSTGWMVSTLGLKLKISAVAMPLVGIGALARMLGKGRWSALGTALAGFGLIFVGIDVLQLGMQGLSRYIDPTSFPAGSLGGRLLLVLIGVVMTVVMQSSSAAVATTVTALSAGALDLTQAAALVVGQNVGTTFTAWIASVGASAAAKRTALTHVLFNAITASVAFVTLPAFVRLTVLLTESIGMRDDAVALAAFHTAFSVLGICLLMPVSGRFSVLVERLVPERGSVLTKHLDASVTRLPAVAIEAAQRSLRDIAEASFEIAERIGRDRKVDAELDEPREALGALQRFLASLSPESELGRDYARHVHVLHAVDHLERFVETLGETENAALSVRAPDVAHLRTKLTAGLAIARRLLTHEHLPLEEAEALHAELEAMWKELAVARKRGRVEVLERTARLRVTPEDALDRLESMRWVDRLGYHTYRALHHVLAARNDGTSASQVAVPPDPDAPAPSLSEPSASS